MKMKKTIYTAMMLLTGLGTSMALSPTAASAQPELSALSPIGMETATVVNPGELAVNAGLAFEQGRERLGLKYDNLHLSPVGVRYGVAPSFEVGGYFGFASNDQDDLLAPDDSGLEGVTLFGKLELNRNAALQVGLRFLGDEDVYPHPSDSVDIFADLALERKLGKGLLYGEFGYTAQGGDFDTNQYINYGVGYAFSLTPTISINGELNGEEAHVGTSANSLDLLMGANFIVANNIRVAPYVTLGLYDASPDWSIGTALEMRF